jgi:hypothetical protein
MSALRILGAILFGSLALSAHAGNIQYVAQERSVCVGIAWPDQNAAYGRSCESPIATDDFGLFDQQVSIVNEWYARVSAEQTSSLTADGISVSSYTYANGTQRDRWTAGSASAESIFDVTFTLDEATRFDFAGSIVGNSLKDYTLQSLAGDEIALNWVHEAYNLDCASGYCDSYSLESRVLLAAGTYQLVVTNVDSKSCSGEWGCEEIYSSERSTDMVFSMSVVPVPPALVLFPSALAALGWVRRRRVNSGS